VPRGLSPSASHVSQQGWARSCRPCAASVEVYTMTQAWGSRDMKQVLSKTLQAFGSRMRLCDSAGCLNH
jgi:hypothetical protein